jgi:hypothetical protein
LCIVCRYGYQAYSPTKADFEYSRYTAEIQFNARLQKSTFGQDAEAIVMFPNNGKPHSGGTCYGDSGSASLTQIDGRWTAVSLVSSGRAPRTCTAHDYQSRTDTPAKYQWIMSQLAA